jgi:hypothetical protein
VNLRWILNSFRPNRDELRNGWGTTLENEKLPQNLLVLVLPPQHVMGGGGRTEHRNGPHETHGGALILIAAMLYSVSSLMVRLVTASGMPIGLLVASCVHADHRLSCRP